MADTSRRRGGALPMGDLFARSASRIFICYRREDTAGYAGRLLDALRPRFGHDRVFMDVTGILPGDQYAAAIDRSIRQSKVVLVVIGPDWLTCVDGSGRRRIDD